MVLKENNVSTILGKFEEIFLDRSFCAKKIIIRVSECGEHGSNIAHDHEISYLVEPKFGVLLSSHYIYITYDGESNKQIFSKIPTTNMIGWRIPFGSHMKIEDDHIFIYSVYLNREKWIDIRVMEK